MLGARSPSKCDDKVAAFTPRTRRTGTVRQRTTDRTAMELAATASSQYWMSSSRPDAGAHRPPAKSRSWAFLRRAFTAAASMSRSSADPSGLTMWSSQACRSEKARFVASLSTLRAAATRRLPS